MEKRQRCRKVARGNSSPGYLNPGAVDISDLLILFLGLSCAFSQCLAESLVSTH